MSKPNLEIQNLSLDWFWISSKIAKMNSSGHRISQILNINAPKDKMQQKYNKLIKHFKAPEGYDIDDYLNPIMYYKSRTQKHVIHLSYKFSPPIKSNSLETDSIEKALAIYKILTWNKLKKTNIDANNEFDFLENKIDKAKGW